MIMGTAQKKSRGAFREISPQGISKMSSIAGSTEL